MAKYHVTHVTYVTARIRNNNTEQDHFYARLINISFKNNEYRTLNESHRYIPYVTIFEKM